MLGPTSWTRIGRDGEVLIGIGTSPGCARLLEQLSLRVDLVTVAQPSEVLGPRSELAPGAIVHRAVLTCGFNVGGGAILF